MTSIECAPGRPVSGRTWKEPAQKASQRATMKTLHVGYHKRMDETRRIRQMKSIEKELKDEKEAARKVRSICNDIC